MRWQQYKLKEEQGNECSDKLGVSESAGIDEIHCKLAITEPMCTIKKGGKSSREKWIS